MSKAKAVGHRRTVFSTEDGSAILNYTDSAHPRPLHCILTPNLAASLNRYHFSSFNSTEEHRFGERRGKTQKSEDKMSTISVSKFITFSVLSYSPANGHKSSSIACPFHPNKFPLLSQPHTSSLPRRTLFLSKSSEAEVSATEDEWLKKLPDKKKPLYSHSLPCIEAWLKSLGFFQSREDRAVWFVEKPEWHAQLSLDVTDLHIRYMKSGPGNLEKDVERRFSYALSREDIQNAMLGGP
ncbi:uncharacterized protein LOC131145952 [Malania oleifera]|uniref:uncharacterized protein LOC131145952 n=1 Tax=Malania oleifera TaxID=397392 RepID=UPI0025AE2B53|nr:uncharacterized protein LOC131145952 [Malania oleifera]